MTENKLCLIENKLCLTENKPGLTEILPAELYLGRAPRLAGEIVKILSSSSSERKKRLTLAESCTGGLASDFIVRIPGASKVFWGSFVTYTDEAKVEMLEVPGELIKKHGAVSRLVALAMAEGALKQSGVDMAVSITGFAGPDGDESSPIGTVWIGLAGLDALGIIWSEAKAFLFTGERNEIREAAAAAALEWVLQYLTNKKG